MKRIEEAELKQQIGKLIVARRKAKKLSQEALAEKLQIKVRTLSKIENGHAFLSASTLCKLCNEFKLSPKSFFDFENSVNTDAGKISDVIDKLSSGGKDKIDFYYEIIKLVDSKYNG